ncbi:MAG: archaellar assembly protein FlaJ [Dehalococcoidales bacterium]|nr:archaellar assembly protein FlaJ [Dehalococcoidales bacterium]
MNWKFWTKKNEPKKKANDAFDAQLSDIDFFSQLSYMAAIAISGISRSGLFYHAAKLPYIATRYFRRVDFVAKMFNRDYAQACRIIGEKIKEPSIKALLLRLSNALASGEDVVAFLDREAYIISESYSHSYERRIDLLRKWSDAYISLILTSALVTVMSVVTMIIGNVSTAFIVSVTALTILVTIFGAWFLYNTAPRETKNHSLPYQTSEQNLVKRLTKILLPIGGIFCIFLVIMGADLGLIMMAASAFLFPVGYVAMQDDKKVGKRDSDIAAFLRSLGGTMAAIGATATEAMGRLDFRSLGILTEDVKLLYTRLLAGISPSLCWNRFVCETGSELVNRSVRMFWDGISLGGEPQKVANEASSYAMKISLLRAQRGQIASGFTWLVIAMHAVLTVLSTFVYQIFVAFSKLVESIAQSDGSGSAISMTGIPSVGFFGQSSTEMNLLHFMIMLVIVVLTLANAFTVYAVSGGHTTKLIYYLAITVAISGVVIYFVPPLVDTMFLNFK